MNIESLIGSLVRGALTGKKKKRKGAARYLSGGSGSFLNASTLLAVAGVAWGVYETMAKKEPVYAGPGPQGAPVPPPGQAPVAPPAPAVPPGGRPGGTPATPAETVPAGPPPPPPPPPITLKFIGLIVEAGAGGRIAVLSDGRFVFHGRPGDIIEGRYRVVRIGDESLEMEHVDGRGRQTIRLSGS